MKLGIMQPYLFPYIGYFQLIAACDQFVIHEDIQYIKGGWINRNRILVNGEPQYITLPIRKDGSDLDINKRYFTPDFGSQKAIVGRRIEGAYRKAPFFKEVSDLIGSCLQATEDNVALFITHTIKQCCDYLGITTPITLSSSLAIDPAIQAEKRVIAINKTIGSDCYINPIGGFALYNRDNFLQQGIKLYFLQTQDLRYSQFSESFVPSLSIIDVMMFNSKDSLMNLLLKRDLV
jgi:hypothetical protein